MVTQITALSHRIVETLRWRILRWEYPPNYTLNETAISQEFRVSRSPVREALRTLAAGGFVERQKNRSYTVKQVRSTDLEELYDLRLALELYCLDIVVKTPELHAGVRELKKKWENFAGFMTQGGQFWVEADEDFHGTLLSLPGKLLFLKEMKRLNERLFVFRLMDFDQPGRMQDTVDQHLAILNAILAGRIQEARDRLAANVLGGRNNAGKGFAAVVASAYEYMDNLS